MSENDAVGSDTQELEELKDQIVQGQQAKDVLENERFKRWFVDAQSALFDVLDTIPLNDREARQRAVDLIYLFRKFEKTFKEEVEIGELSQQRWREIVEADKKKGLLSRVFDP